MRRNPSLRALCVLALLGVAGVAHADWMRDYDRGVREFEDGNWREAESLMRSAMKDRPDSSERQRFQGTVFKPYMPHHYAGVAAWRLGDCQRALDYWSNASNQSAVAKLDGLGPQQRSGMDTCKTQLAQASKPTSGSTSTASTGAGTPTNTGAGTGSSAPPKSGGTGSTTTTAQNTKPADPVPKPPPKPPVEPRPTPSAGPAPAALRSLVDQFMRGRYADVVRSNPSGLPDAKARAHGFLLRAAAAFTQAELDGRSGSALDQARADVRAARAAQQNLQTDSSLFSPRFRAFYAETR